MPTKKYGYSYSYSYISFPSTRQPAMAEELLSAVRRDSADDVEQILRLHSTTILKTDFGRAFDAACSAKVFELLLESSQGRVQKHLLEKAFLFAADGNKTEVMNAIMEHKNLFGPFVGPETVEAAVFLAAGQGFATMLRSVLAYAKRKQIKCLTSITSLVDVIRKASRNGHDDIVRQLLCSDNLIVVFRGDKLAAAIDDVARHSALILDRFLAGCVESGVFLSADSLIPATAESKAVWDSYLRWSLLRRLWVGLVVSQGDSARRRAQGFQTPTSKRRRRCRRA